LFQIVGSFLTFTFHKVTQAHLEKWPLKWNMCVYKLWRGGWLVCVLQWHTAWRDAAENSVQSAGSSCSQPTLSVADGVITRMRSVWFTLSLSILTTIFTGGPRLAGTRSVSILDFVERFQIDVVSRSQCPTLPAPSSYIACRIRRSTTLCTIFSQIIRTLFNNYCHVCPNY